MLNKIKSVGMNDIWLSAFFVILLIHMAMSMMFPLPENDAKLAIDVVTRTATALLAGYFISKNFVTKTLSNYADKNKQTRHIYQTTIVAVMGLFCLFLLILIRYIPSIQVSTTTLSQVRDIYLASTAFLIGTAKE